MAYDLKNKDGMTNREWFEADDLVVFEVCGPDGSELSAHEWADTMRLFVATMEYGERHGIETTVAARIGFFIYGQMEKFLTQDESCEND